MLYCAAVYWQREVQGWGRCGRRLLAALGWLGADRGEGDGLGAGCRRPDRTRRSADAERRSTPANASLAVFVFFLAEVEARLQQRPIPIPDIARGIAPSLKSFSREVHGQ